MNFDGRLPAYFGISPSKSFGIPVLLPVVSRLIPRQHPLLRQPLTPLYRNQINRRRDEFDQSFVVLDPVLQSGEENVFHDRDLLLPGHEVKDLQGSKRVASGAISSSIQRLSLFLQRRY